MGAAFRHAARVKVRARDGRAWEKLLLHRRGSPEHPLAPPTWNTSSATS
jgi:hypothetical protein